ncbi:nitroreductase family protein [Natranaerofaba carboxydovora]|uniref:nitroreductase family protein n=1 Tax=Natranaerofaba carboxydovora TaxID=2742683 RepID=UPI001F1429C9|nr:nitroreductase family protein [Natranaerofaba carboxydovora]UMZ74196.1 NADPH-flavin oxidoreductase [Natranaerofaba carboxydovora]
MIDNNKLDLIFERRSVRKYKDKKIEDEKVEKILQAAMAAPTAMNKQPWFFVVIRDEIVLKQLSTVHPYAGMIKDASACIVVCGDKKEEYWIQDCSAAMQNILLAATALNIGSVWIGIYPKQERIEKTSQLIDLEEGYLPLGLAVLGYPDEIKGTDTKYRRDKVRYMN